MKTILGVTYYDNLVWLFVFFCACFGFICHFFNGCDFLCVCVLSVLLSGRLNIVPSNYVPTNRIGQHSQLFSRLTHFKCYGILWLVELIDWFANAIIQMKLSITYKLVLVYSVLINWLWKNKKNFLKNWLKIIVRIQTVEHHINFSLSNFFLKFKL